MLEKSDIRLDLIPKYNLDNQCKPKQYQAAMEPLGKMSTNRA